MDRRYSHVDHGMTFDQVHQVMGNGDSKPPREDFVAFWGLQRIMKDDKKIKSGLWYFDPHIGVAYEFTFDSDGVIVGKRKWTYNM